jgi:hypothetical protein
MVDEVAAMGGFEFWRKWLFWASVFFGVFGVVVATLGDSALFGMWRAAAARHFFEAESFPEQVNRFRLFLFGPIGGTIAGSYVFQAYLAHEAFRRRERWAWKASVGALLAWFVTDSAVSALHGAYFNIYLINVFALAGIGLPLAMTRKGFYEPEA